ncbi:unnamed protein product [Danaus chrysippus]|uniref:(African queen) hypothetical protein n=1 Tax=Danaus chrysippus TaxID=151541 RepID=A0A8J2QKV0_9NEOP|nr:unnamed protein product [Danaus chrysippus]
MILFVSYLIESKRYVKDFKIMLERQDNQVKNVVTLCMNTIKEMKTGQLLLDHQDGRSLNALNRTCKLQNKLKRVRVIAIVMRRYPQAEMLLCQQGHGLIWIGKKRKSTKKENMLTQNSHSPSTSPKAKTIAERKSWKLSPGSKNRKTSPVPKAKITYNVASQTNIVVDIPNKEKMGKVIKELHSKVEVLEAEFQTREPETLSVPDPLEQMTDCASDDYFRPQQRRRTSKRKRDFDSHHGLRKGNYTRN